MTNFKLAGVHIWQDGADVDGGKTWYGSARADVNYLCYFKSQRD